MTSDTSPAQPTFVAFAAGRLLARGTLEVVARAAKLAIDAGEPRAVQVFDAQTSEPWDLDLGGTIEEVVARHRFEPPRVALNARGYPVDADDAPIARILAGSMSPPARTGPGRPKLGVVAREVTLLPRHWTWLNDQPGGASAAIRRLVEEARKSKAPADVIRRARDSVYRFLVATLGDAPGFEEAMRALYAGDERQFTRHSKEWPADLRTHAVHLAHPVFHAEQA